MDYLNTCQSCNNIIQFKNVICPLCRAFQMHIDYDIEDKKMYSYSLMSERRYLCQEQVNKMIAHNKSDDEINHVIECFEAKEEEIKKNIIKKVDKIQNYLLN